jgi:hypothetical protein
MVALARGRKLVRPRSRHETRRGYLAHCASLKRYEAGIEAQSGGPDEAAQYPGTAAGKATTTSLPRRSRPDAQASFPHTRAGMSPDVRDDYVRSCG